jgi:YidC/Oxa1 family membrane protein insertase
MIAARFRVENGSQLPMAVPAMEWSLGSAEPENQQDKGDLVGFAWHDGKSAHQFNQAWFDNKSLGCFPGTPRTEYRAAAGGTAVQARWAATYSQFFFLAVMTGEPGIDVSGRHFPLPPPTPEELAANPLALTNQSAYAVSLVQRGTNVAAGARTEREFTLFAGPKEYHVLEWLGSSYKNDLDSVMGYGGIFGFFSRFLLLAMNTLHSIGLSYALAIIAITVILKVLFWPLTQASTRSMKRMQELAPQMKAMQEKYKGEPEKLQKKTMEFYRENKVNPMSGCLPMLVQIPVFIGFFTMVRSAIELRGATFLWATDLSRPDTVAVLPIFNLMGITMLIQTRLTPVSPGMDPAQAKMMRYMPLFFLVILYNYSAGLTLYWTVQNVLTIVQTKLTRAKDAASKAEPAGKAAAPVAAVKRRK